MNKYGKYITNFRNFSYILFDHYDTYNDFKATAEWWAQTLPDIHNTDIDKSNTTYYDFNNAKCLLEAGENI